MDESRNASASEPVAWRFPDPEAEAFWREHLQRLHDPDKIEALCRREHDEMNARFHRGLDDGSFVETDKDLVVGTLDGVRRWWAGELLKLHNATPAEKAWAQRVLSLGWF